MHFKNFNHFIYLNIFAQVEKLENIPEKIDKLAINKEGGILDKEIINYNYKLYC